MKKIKTLAFFNLLALIFHIIFSYITQLKLNNNPDIGQISDKYDSVFTPAGITFAIWGVIYAALLVFCIYHLVMAFSRRLNHPANNDISRMGIWFILNNLAAVAWIYVWTNELITVSLGLIILQLLTLIFINLRLGIHDPHKDLASKVFTQFPLSIYFGWLTIATIANASIYLLDLGWDGFGYNPVYWTRIMIGVAVFLTSIVVFTRRNVFFGLVIIWALYGIILKRQTENAYLYTGVIRTALTGAGIVGIVCLIQFIQNLGLKKNPSTFSNSSSPLE